MASDSPIFWFLPPELLIQTRNFKQIIFLFLVSIHPIGCQEHSLPDTVHTKYSSDSQNYMSYGVTTPHTCLLSFAIFIHIFLFSPFFLFHTILRGQIPSLTLDTKEVAYGGNRVQSTSIMYNVRALVQLQVCTQLSRWLHTRASCQELKIHVWAETK